MMSSEKKRIEASKHRVVVVVVDPEYADKTWKILHAIHEIFNHKGILTLSHQDLYRHAFDMVLHKHGEKLYSGLVSTM
ncbi:putative cullin repeat-like-containing domain superfamily [Helianthus annuus]|uniref:Cullin repeat-like-containing domain superfamily n=1 Tax=Helianthus annuus TaxID=4232 RepID=A0A251SIK6_HELAN|nr:putative cullin repeat-like-containing domain superfamily [Helianthus annuus]KAJ0485698.1 putative cullin repeat-like-containing domain superfamily [Helianthus annuus]KAJ0656252.1 putative cullin repeat-like-containing domain superfamily [Helianthus annuus]KAJ0840320.1 putative cullin repeat-like-containing domain superfamily [Helianthus annuus]